MSRMALETAIRLSAEVKGGANITKVQRSLQDLAKGGQTTAREMNTLRSATFQFARANDSTIAGIRGGITAFRGLQEQAKIGTREFARYGSEIQRLEAKLRGLDGTAKAAGSSLSLRGAAASAGGSMLMGGGLQASLGAAAGSMAAGGTVAGMALAGGVMAGGALLATGTTNALDEAASSRRIRTLSDDADVLMERIRQLTTDQGYLSNSAEAGAAAYEILSSGFSKTADVLAILKASTYGATGGFSDIKTVADAATSIMNSFGLGADKVTRVVDQMVQTQNDGKIVVDQYAQSVGRLAPTFAVAGLSVEEMNAAISALTAKGAPVESTMSGLNQTVKSIIKPTEEAKAVAAALGLEFSAAALQAKGLGGFLQDVTDKTKGNTTALGVLFSDIDGFKAVASLTNDGLKAYNKSLANMETLTGQSAKAARLAVDPVKQFDNAWKDFSATAGGLVVPALTGVLEGLTGILDALRSTDWARLGSLVQAQDGGPVAGQYTPAQIKALSESSGKRGGNWNDMPWPEGIPRPGTAPPKPRMRAPRLPENTAITGLVNGVVGGGGGGAGGGKAPAGRIIEYLTGDRGSAGYRADHGGSNYHDHLAFGSTAQRNSAMKALQGAGIKIGSVNDGRHAKGSYHYSGQAFDVPGGQVPVGQEAGLSALVRKVLGGAGFVGKGIGKEAAYADDLAGLRAQGEDKAAEIAKKAKEDAKRKDEEDKRRKEQIARQLSSARDLLTSNEAALRVTEATTPLGKLSAEYDQQRARRMGEYADLLRAALSDEERRALITSQQKAIGAAEVAYKKELKQLTEDQLKTEQERATLAIDAERERAQALQESLSYMQELSSRDSIATGFQQGIQSYVDSIGNMRDAVGQLTTDTIGGLSNALGELATTGTVQFREFAVSVLKETGAMIMRQLVLKTIMSAIGGIGGGVAKTFEMPGAGFFGGGGVDFGQALGMPLLNAKGNVFGGDMVNSPTMFKFASGGAFRTGIMGEAGPEAIMPLRRGRDGKLGVAAAYPAIPGIPAGGTDGAMGDPGVIGAAGGVMPGSSSSSSTSRFERTDAVLTRMVEAAKQGSVATAAAAVAAGGGGTTRVQLEVSKINNVEYITLEQAQGIAAAAANRSTARERRSLQGSPAARRGVGI
jgi:lambda family phage tail tape measure protein/TP901 family phage tail tape measure protein